MATKEKTLDGAFYECGCSYCRRSLVDFFDKLGPPAGTQAARLRSIHEAL